MRAYWVCGRVIEPRDNSRPLERKIGMKELTPEEVARVRDAYRLVKKPRRIARGEEYKQAVLVYAGLVQGLADSGVPWKVISGAAGISVSRLKYYPKVCRERVWSFSRSEEYLEMCNR